MDRKEFGEWAADFARRFPSTGDWVRNLPQETRDVWFDDCFSRFELRDCMAANLQLMTDGDFEPWQRERLPAIFIRRVSQIRYERTQRQQEVAARKEAAKRRKQQRGGSFAAGLTKHFTPSMLKTFDEVRGHMDTHRERTGERMPDHRVEELVDIAFNRYDTNDDDPTNGPRFKCATCQDTGFVGFRDEDGVPYAGHCTCEIGLKRRDDFRSEGRELGMSPSMKRDVVEWDVP